MSWNALELKAQRPAPDSRIDLGLTLQPNGIRGEIRVACFYLNGLGPSNSPRPIFHFAWWRKDHQPVHLEPKNAFFLQ